VREANPSVGCPKNKSPTPERRYGKGMIVAYPLKQHEVTAGHDPNGVQRLRRSEEEGREKKVP